LFTSSFLSNEINSVFLFDRYPAVIEAVIVNKVISIIIIIKLFILKTFYVFVLCVSGRLKIVVLEDIFSSYCYGFFNNGLYIEGKIKL
jgi:hypothetical protein